MIDTFVINLVSLSKSKLASLSKKVSLSKSPYLLKFPYLATGLLPLHRVYHKKLTPPIFAEMNHSINIPSIEGPVSVVRG